MGTGDLVHFFDVRQGARLSTLFGPDFEENLAQLRATMRVESGQGSFLDKMFATQNKGVVGAWGRMEQGFTNMFVAMAESGVMDTVANGMNKIAEGLRSLSTASPGLLKFITFGIMGVAVLAPLGFMLSGLGAGFKLLRFAATGVGWLFGKIVPRLLSTRLAMVGARYGVRALAWEMLKFTALGPWKLIVGGFKMLGRGVWSAISRLGPLVGRGLLSIGRWIGSAALRFGPLLMRGLLTVGPWLLRGIAAAFGLLSNPVGWAILAASAAALIWTYRTEIANGWSKITAWFAASAWPAIKRTASALLGWGGEVVSSIGASISGAWGRVTGWFSGTAWPAVKATGSALLSWRSGMVDSILSGLANAWPRLKAWFSEKWAGLKSALSFGGGQAGGVGIASTGGTGLAVPQGPKLAGKRARGGPVLGGKFYLVGERGPELFRAPMGGRIIPAGPTERMLAANDTAPRLASLGAPMRMLAADNSSPAVKPVSQILPDVPEHAGQGVVPAGVLAAMRERRAAPSAPAHPFAPVFNIYGATDPQATARAVRTELKRIANGNFALLND